MAIEQIGIGAAPGDNTGDGLRTAMGKVNNNFSNASHAASKLTGTDPEKVPLNSDLGDSSTRNVGLNTGDVLSPEGAGLDSGETNWTSGNFEVGIELGFGVMRIMKNITGATIVTGQVVPAASLERTFFDSGLLQSTPSGIVGSWMQVTGGVGPAQAGEFVRVQP